MPLVKASLTTEPLDVPAHLAAVDDPRRGAAVVFVGQVRDHDPEAPGTVRALDYTSHPDAVAVLAQCVEDVLAEAARIGADGADEALVAISHRVGHLEVGDLALVCCVSTAHRDLAQTLCAEIVEQVKRRVPIWKKQILADGSHVWSGLGSGLTASPPSPSPSPSPSPAVVRAGGGDG